ncbi:MAG TPA: hypothetical protein VND40_03065 [Nitrososphaerales archaeon]|nr:hypothetical protein [Nitrososphaerales archaeon]
MLLSPLQVDIGAVATDTSILSSIAIILGAVFVVYQIRQDKDMLAAQVRAADANAEQARLTMKQFLQNNELATMDLVMRIYEFADSMDVQRSFFTVLSSKIASLEDYEKLPDDKKLAFLQVASLFESLGFLVDKGFVKAEIVDDMFATKIAWEMTKPFILGMRQKFAAEDYYFFFERLFNRLSKTDTGSITGEYLAKKADGKLTG